MRREPIDLERIAAEFAERGEQMFVAEVAGDASPARRTESEIIAALEAEVARVNAARAAAAPASVAAVPIATTVPTVAIPHGPGGRPAGAPKEVGLPLEQVRAWLEQVKEDLRKVQARVEYLQYEQSRLQGQHHLVAELAASTSQT